MKAYINIKNNSNLHTHQTLNKSIWLMKRESGRSPIHHFSFGERFDETLMKVYCNVCQCVRLSNHQFIGFSPPHQICCGKGSTIPACMPLCRQAIMPAQRHGISYKAGKKKKATNVHRHHRRHHRRLLGKQKAIAH